MKEVTELVIDRARWGTGIEGGVLYSSDTKKMCCLGFLARAYGSKVKDITNKGFPSDGQAPEAFCIGEHGPNVAARKAADANDNPDGRSRDREAAIRSIFANAGIKVKFVGKLGKPKKKAA